MIVLIDDETALQLLRLVGTRLIRVVGRRYPNPPSYDQVQLVTEGGIVLLIELRIEEVGEKLEVSSISAREVPSVAASGQCDEIRLADFRIDHVLVLRRAEWLEQVADAVGSVGENALEQRFGNPSEAPPWLTHALVDAGIVFLDDRGSQLEFVADAFPLVMQSRYSVSSTKLPHGDARVLEARV